MERLHAITDRINDVMTAVLKNKEMIVQYTRGSRSRGKDGSRLAKRRAAAVPLLKKDIDSLLEKVPHLRDEYEEAVAGAPLSEKERRATNETRILLNQLASNRG